MCSLYFNWVISPKRLCCLWGLFWKSKRGVSILPPSSLAVGEIKGDRGEYKTQNPGRWWLAQSGIIGKHQRWFGAEVCKTLWRRPESEPKKNETPWDPLSRPETLWGLPWVALSWLKAVGGRIGVGVTHLPSGGGGPEGENTTRD